MTEMRPDPDSDLAGAQSEYGDDTGFAAEATRTSSPEVTGPDGTAGMTAEDEAEAAPDDPTAGPGAGAD